MARTEQLRLAKRARERAAGMVMIPLKLGVRDAAR